MAVREWLTLEDVAADSGIPLKNIYYYHENNKGPTAYKFGRHIRIKKEDFQSWLPKARRLSSNIKVINPKVIKRKQKKVDAVVVHPSARYSTT